MSMVVYIFIFKIKISIKLSKKKLIVQFGKKKLTIICQKQNSRTNIGTIQIVAHLNRFYPILPYKVMFKYLDTGDKSTSLMNNRIKF
jgi:hypothetical protein